MTTIKTKFDISKNKYTIQHYVIFGAGIYGCYAAIQLSIKYPHKNIIVLEYDNNIFLVQAMSIKHAFIMVTIILVLYIQL